MCSSLTLTSILTILQKKFLHFHLNHLVANSRAAYVECEMENLWQRKPFAFCCNQNKKICVLCMQCAFNIQQRPTTHHSTSLYFSFCMFNVFCWLLLLLFSVLVIYDDFRWMKSKVKMLIRSRSFELRFFTNVCLHELTMRNV